MNEAIWRRGFLVALGLALGGVAAAQNASVPASSLLPPGKSIDSRYVGIWEARTSGRIIYHTAYPDGEFERWRLDKEPVVTGRGIWYVDDGTFHIVLLKVRSLHGAAMVAYHLQFDEKITATTDHTYTVDEPGVPDGYLRWDCMRRDIPERPPAGAD